MNTFQLPHTKTPGLHVGPVTLERSEASFLLDFGVRIPIYPGLVVPLASFSLDPGIASQIGHEAYSRNSPSNAIGYLSSSGEARIHIFKLDYPATFFVETLEVRGQFVFKTMGIIERREQEWVSEAPFSFHQDHAVSESHAALLCYRHIDDAVFHVPSFREYVRKIGEEEEARFLLLELPVASPNLTVYSDGKSLRTVTYNGETVSFSTREAMPHRVVMVMSDCFPDGSKPVKDVHDAVNGKSREPRRWAQINCSRANDALVGLMLGRKLACTGPDYLVEWVPA